MRWNKLRKTEKASCWLANRAPLWLCFILLFSSSISYAADLISYINAKLYHVRHTVCGYNKNITAMNYLELNVPLPESWPDCKVSNIKITGDDPFLLHNTEGPGQIYRTTYKNGLPKKGTVAFVSAEYDVQLWEVNAKYDDLMRQSYPEYTKDSEYQYYMQASPDISPDAPEIRPILDELRQKGNGHPVTYAKAVYDWVGQNIKYVETPPSDSLSVCFKERKGNCGTIAAFFVALCRAGGVPARFVAGCWAGGFDGWHCW
ncbi:MAG TPA: transglutaminase domain-containing protein, partial [Sedimentisphaerales bacterium]